jgi:hypothetical protein
MTAPQPGTKCVETLYADLNVAANMVKPLCTEVGFAQSGSTQGRRLKDFASAAS